MGNCCSGQEAEDSPGNHELSEVNTINFVNDEAWIRRPDLVVTQIHFVAATLLQNGGNHWNMHLQTSKDESVKIDLEPSAWPGPFQHGYLGRLDISRRSYAITRHRHHCVTVPARPGVAAVSFLKAIVNADNHRYEFTQAGRGCTGWMRDQFFLFVQQGLLQPGYERQIEEAMTQEWNRGRATRPWPVTQGYYLRDLNAGGGNRRRRRQRQR
ncbi:hypothetical protein NKR23_g1754 [Pleurostoma richardsiae]|uniref:DUF7770 domain-containing protein n=1 Tax=Pleurostoma richardsiae TaxID=41990 RepID=A0AA38VW79_9PEZI|nr:hypothetical protein NKR23_g1754 [Pleurostoma richardsiae]